MGPGEFEPNPTNGDREKIPLGQVKVPQQYLPRSSDAITDVAVPFLCINRIIKIEARIGRGGRKHISSEGLEDTDKSLGRKLNPKFTIPRHSTTSYPFSVTD